jgi:hypothetical protein
MIGADTPHGDELPFSLLPGFSQNKLQLSNFVSPINGRTQIVSFDPEVINPQMSEWMDRCRESAQGHTPDFFFEFRIPAKQT